MTLNKSDQPPDLGGIFLGLVTFPFLGGLLATHTLGQALIELGEASEEIFRGDRLPILNFPNPQSEDELC